MSTSWRKLATIASNLKALATRIWPSSLLESHIRAPSNNFDVEPLNFPEIPASLPQLLDIGVSQDCASLLHIQFVNAARKVDEALSEIYSTHAPKFLDKTHPLSVGSRSAYIRATQDHLLTVRTQAIARLWSALLSQAQQLVDEARPIQGNAQARSSSSTTDCAPSGKRKRQGRPSTFTPEQTFALNALLARDDQFSSEDKEFIAQQLNLTRDQVNRWFCNARARKKKACRGGSPASFRTASSDLTSAESHQSDQDTTSSEVMINWTPVLDHPSTGFTIPTPNTTTSDFTYSTPAVTNPDTTTFTGTTITFTNPTTTFTHPTTAFTDPTLQVDSLDLYLDYSECSEPEKTPSDLTDNLPAPQDLVGDWCTHVNMPVSNLSFSSSAEPQVAVPEPQVVVPEPQFAVPEPQVAVPEPQVAVPEPHDWSGGLTSFNDPLFNPLGLDPIQLPFPLAFTPESPLSNHVISSFDLSEW